MYITRQDILDQMEKGEWHHQSQFLPLTDRIPAEVACRMYLCVSKKTTKARRKKEDAFTQASRGSREYLFRYLRTLVYAGVLERKPGERRGRLSEFYYRIVETNGNVTTTDSVPAAGSQRQPDSTEQSPTA